MNDFIGLSRLVGLRDLECGRAEIGLYGVKRSRDFCVLGLVLGGVVGGLVGGGGLN
jgi:hypothetical protein